MPHRSRPAPAARGFTLVEILVLVVIIGVLAAVAVPKLSNAAPPTREGALREEVAQVRQALEAYRAQHRNAWPGLTDGTPDARVFSAQLTSATTGQGGWDLSNPRVVTGAFACGPYLREFPQNPVNHLETVKMASSADTACASLVDGTTGWIYNAYTGEFLPNLVGADTEGRMFAQY